MRKSKFRPEKVVGILREYENPKLCTPAGRYAGLALDHAFAKEVIAKKI